MRRNGPMVTLLAGIGVAVVVLLLSMRAAGSGQEAVAPVAPPPVALETSAPPADVVPSAAPSIDRVPLAARTGITATWAGKLEPGSLAVSATDGTAIAYLCDGKRVEAWLKGTAAGGKLTLTGAKGASLSGTYDKGQARGTVRAGNRTWSFEVAAVAKPSGLYRAVRNVRGAKVVGGWIVLRDGSQVGLGTVDGTVRETSGLDLTSGAAMIDGLPVRATRAEGDA